MAIMPNSEILRKCNTNINQWDLSAFVCTCTFLHSSNPLMACNACILRMLGSLLHLWVDGGYTLRSYNYCKPDNISYPFKLANWPKSIKSPYMDANIFGAYILLYIYIYLNTFLRAIY